MPPLDDCEDAQYELIKNAPVISHVFAVLDPLCNLQDVIDCKGFSTFDRLLRTTAYVIHFKKKFKGLKSSSHPAVDQTV